MNYVDEEIPRHRKKSQAKPPKKSKHKHIYEPCIIEYPTDWYYKEHERSGERRSNFYGFCPICGKVGETDQGRWWTEDLGYVGHYLVHNTVPTEEGARELNPETRTLPTFFSDSPFPKTVNIEEKIL